MVQNILKKERCQYTIHCELAAVKVSNLSEFVFIIISTCHIALKQSFAKRYGANQSHGECLLSQSKRKFGSLVGSNDNSSSSIRLTFVLHIPPR